MPCGLNGIDVCGGVAAKNYEEHDKNFADEHVVLVGRFAYQEPAVQIVDEVGGSPIQLGADSGHERGQEGCNHQSSERGGKKIAEHHHVAFFRLGGKFHTGMQAAMRRINGDSYQAGKNPGPGTHGVVGDVEP